MEFIYFPRAIIQQDENSVPCLVSLSMGEDTLTEALFILQNAKKSLRLLSVWVDKLDAKGNTSTVFHECLVDALGNINKTT